MFKLEDHAHESECAASMACVSSTSSTHYMWTFMPYETQCTELREHMIRNRQTLLYGTHATTTKHIQHYTFSAHACALLRNHRPPFHPHLNIQIVPSLKYIQDIHGVKHSTSCDKHPLHKTEYTHHMIACLEHTTQLKRHACSCPLDVLLSFMHTQSSCFVTFNESTRCHQLKNLTI